MSATPVIIIGIYPHDKLRTFRVNAAGLVERLNRLIDTGNAFSFYDICGVENVNLDVYTNVYEVRIVIGPEFTWADIQPYVVNIIKRQLDMYDCHVLEESYRHGVRFPELAQSMPR